MPADPTARSLANTSNLWHLQHTASRASNRILGGPCIVGYQKNPFYVRTTNAVTACMGCAQSWVGTTKFLPPSELKETIQQRRMQQFRRTLTMDLSTQMSRGLHSDVLIKPNEGLDPGLTGGKYLEKGPPAPTCPGLRTFSRSKITRT